MNDTLPPVRFAPMGRRAAVVTAGVLLAWTTTASASVPSEGYADLVETVSPAVVYVSSTRKPVREMADAEGMPEGRFPPGSPFEDFFKHFRERMPEGRGPATAVGSGFVISPDGYIVTNNHVVAGAETVSVTLADDAELTAEVVGTDAKTDLALLKLETDEPLTAVAWGDSDTLRPGDVVLAVGNPFGLGGSVTAGIVSGRGRNIQAGPYDDFIQTDAAINRGNSGGPMFNTGGEVVGVNTAIYSPSGGNIGIGFAIPANMARSVVDQLKESGRVERGWLGVQIQAVTDEIAGAVGLDADDGALVTRVLADSPAAEAELRQGDVIVRFDGQPVEDVRDLSRLVAGTPAGRTVDVEVWRDETAETIAVEIDPMEAEQVAAATHTDGGATQSSDELGARLSSLDDDLRARFNLDESVNGVMIVDVDPAGRAASHGLRQGDVIATVDSRPVRTPAEVATALEEAEKDAVLLLLNRGGNEMFVGINLTA